MEKSTFYLQMLIFWVDNDGKSTVISVKCLYSRFITERLTVISIEGLYSRLITERLTVISVKGLYSRLMIKERSIVVYIKG